MLAYLMLLGWIALCLALPLSGSYLLDRRAHEGASWLRRRRVLRRGVEAAAKVLSTNVLAKWTGTNGLGRSIVYEVLPPPPAAPFRARGIEVMYSHDLRANPLLPGSTVTVRYDPDDLLVVLVWLRAADVERARAAAVHAQEEALLAGRERR